MILPAVLRRVLAVSFLCTGLIVSQDAEAASCSREAQINIDWIFIDSNATYTYYSYIDLGYSIFDSILETQGHNPNAQASIRSCGQEGVEEYLALNHPAHFSASIERAVPIEDAWSEAGDDEYYDEIEDDWAELLLGSDIWNAVASVTWNEADGSASAASGYSGDQPSEESARAAAEEACRGAGGYGCQTVATWNSGCGFITVGNNYDGVLVVTGASQAETYDDCTARGYSCEWPIGGCID